MADNTLLNLGSGGDTIASDDIGGIKFQRVKLIHGPDGTNSGDVSTTNGLPIQGVNVAATTGSWTSATTLNTAVSISVAGMNAVSVAIVTTSTFTGGVVTFEVSPDNSNWFTVSMARIDSYTVETTYTLVATTSRAWTTSVDGFTNFRVKLSSVITGTGTATVFVVPQVFSIEPIVAVGQATAASLNATAVLAAGSSIVGKVGIDQTTPGITNLVQVGGSLPIGSNIIGNVGITAAQTIAVTQATASSLNATITPPSITKGTQGSTGITTQNLKDAGRTSICLTAEVAGAAATETLATITESRSGAAVATFTSKTITSGKIIRFSHVSMEVETLGSGTAPQRMYLRLRVNTAGATIATSPIQGVWCVVNSTAIVKSGNVATYNIPDGIEFTGNGTVTYGFTITFPDWVTTTGTVAGKVTVIGFEY